MADIPGPLGEWLADRIPKLASMAHRRFPRVPAEDFEQEMWAKAYANRLKHAKWLREEHDGFIIRDLKAATVKLGNEDDRYRRAVKASREGYRIIDEQFYSTGLLAKTLAVLIRAEFDVSAAVAAASHTTDSAGVHVTHEDPEAFGTYQAVLMDVCAAYNKLKRGDQHFLKLYYEIPEEDTEEYRWERRRLASSQGMTYEAFKQRAYDARRRLQRELGGEDPWRKQDREAA
jgi:hypothetical protein